MKIALVYPPSWDSITPPLGISSIKSFLSKKRFDVTCFDFSIELNGKFFDGAKDKLDKCVKKILKEAPDILGFSLLDPNVKHAMYVAEKVKNESKDVSIIVGGPQVSYVGNEILQNYNFVDIAIAGEGEQGFLDILSDEKRLSELKSSRTVLHSPWVQDLNSLPFPDFDDFNLKDYPVCMLPLYTNRGCVRRCTFCGVVGNRLFGPYRERKPQLIFEEIKRNIEKYGIRNFLITDALVNANSKFLERICDLIIKSNLEVKWGAEAFPKINKKTLNKMYASGCRFLWISPESGSPKTLQKMGKGVNLKEAEKTIVEAGKNGIFVSTWFIIGFPGENEMDIKRTAQFARKVKEYSKELLFVPFTLMKGSYVYDNPSEFGINETKRNPCSIWSTFKSKNLMLELEAVMLTISLWEEFNDLGLRYPFLEDYSDEEIRYILENLQPEQREVAEKNIKETKNKKPYSYGEIFKSIFVDD